MDAGVVLVTGGSGYFGSLLLRKLLERGRRCRVFDLNDADDRPAEVEFVRGDVRDYEAVRRACAGTAAVHHNVAQVPLAKDRALFEGVNVGGTTIVIEGSADQQTLTQLRQELDRRDQALLAKIPRTLRELQSRRMA